MEEAATEISPSTFLVYFPSFTFDFIFGAQPRRPALDKAMAGSISYSLRSLVSFA
jgi:hypothetical protein